jgi:hypothetical protein
MAQRCFEPGTHTARSCDIVFEMTITVPCTGDPDRDRWAFHDELYSICSAVKQWMEHQGVSNDDYYTLFESHASIFNLGVSIRYTHYIEKIAMDQD